MTTRPLEGRVALVAGATRGAGRGIAEMLGEAGATVYCTGRSSRAADRRGVVDRREPPFAPFDLARRPETIEETAERVRARGGEAIAVRCDHTDTEQVRALAERIRAERGGRLDLLVNDVWGGDHLIEFNKPFWELDPAKGLEMIDRVLHTHLLTSRHLVPLMVARGEGLVVEVTDGAFLGYRGQLQYDLAKLIPIRLAYAMQADFDGKGLAGLTALAVSPGFLRSEAMLELFEVTEANWRDGAKRDPHFAQSETPYYVGRAVAALAADPRVGRRGGQAFHTGELARAYGFTDADGRTPDFDGYLDGVVAAIVARGEAEDAAERELVKVRYHQLELDPTRAEDVRRMARFLGMVPRAER